MLRLGGKFMIREYTPSPLLASNSGKCPGDLEKFPALDPKGKFRIREWRNMKKYVWLSDVGVRSRRRNQKVRGSLPAKSKR